MNECWSGGVEPAGKELSRESVGVYVCVCVRGEAGGGCVLGIRRCRFSSWQDCQVKTSGAITKVPWRFQRLALLPFHFQEK